MARLADLALAGHWEEARALHFRLLPLMEVNFIESSPGPVKAAMAMMGLLQEQFRLPLVPIKDASRARVREVLSGMSLLTERSHAAA
jgi:4-hydroxy-tetrahydrodipicolinate synthase